MAAFQTYSFLDVQATLTGPNVTVTIGNTSGTAEEGISIAFAEDHGIKVGGICGMFAAENDLSSNSPLARQAAEAATVAA